MPDLEFTGERFVPGVIGDLAYEHWHRYAFARRFAIGKRVLDAACGEGYGTALLAEMAIQAIGVDIDEAAVAHARSNYAGRGTRLRFEAASVTELPLADSSLDVVVSFETIEHLPAADQPRMLAEFARVLAPGGVLLLSSPNKRRYTDERNHHNPFHLHELYRDELAQLLDAGFPHRRWFHQARSYASALWSEDLDGDNATCEALSGDADTVVPMTAPEGLYYLVFAAASVSALPAAPQVSLFADRNDTERKRVDANLREVLRLDALLKERDAGLDRQTAHIHHLERLVAERERIVVERDAQLVEVNAARSSHEQALLAERPAWANAKESLLRCESELSTARKALAALQVEQRSLAAAVAAQERIISHRQSVRWWLQLPWLRAKLYWQQWRGQ